MDEKDNHGATPVLVAIESTNGSAETIRLLHSRGAYLNVGLRSSIPLLYQIDAFQKHGNQNMPGYFHDLLEKTTNINYTDTGGNNALHRLCMAIPDRSSACIEQMLIALLKRGCSMTTYNAQGFSPFQLLVNGWSMLRDDKYGVFSGYCPMHKRREAVDLILEFKGTYPEIGLIKALLKYNEGGAGNLGPPSSANYEGSGLLSLATRTSDEELIDGVLMYDNEVDKRDRLPDDDGIPSRSDSLPIEAKTPLE